MRDGLGAVSGFGGTEMSGRTAPEKTEFVCTLFDAVLEVLAVLGVFLLVGFLCEGVDGLFEFVEGLDRGQGETVKEGSTTDNGHFIEGPRCVGKEGKGARSGGTSRHGAVTGDERPGPVG